MKTVQYDPKQPLQWHTSFLLSRLEYLDSSICQVENTIWRLFGNVEKRRQRLRKKVLAKGVSCLRTVLKQSRREGWDYRDDVYTIIEKLTGDPIGLFIQGLSDPDIEIQVSCSKWLRDKCRGESRVILPLIEYLKEDPTSGNATTALQYIEVDATGPIVDLITDSNASCQARIGACAYFQNSNEIDQNSKTRLRKIADDPNEDEVIRSYVIDLLENPTEKSSKI